MELTPWFNERLGFYVIGEEWSANYRAAHCYYCSQIARSLKDGKYWCNDHAESIILNV